MIWGGGGERKKNCGKIRKEKKAGFSVRCRSLVTNFLKATSSKNFSSQERFVVSIPVLRGGKVLELWIRQGNQEDFVFLIRKGRWVEGVLSSFHRAGGRGGEKPDSETPHDPREPWSRMWDVRIWRGFGRSGRDLNGKRRRLVFRMLGRSNSVPTRWLRRVIRSGR